MAIDKTLLHLMLNNLKTVLLRIEGMDSSMEEILENEDTQDMLDRRMQVAIENCIDIANHLAAGMDLPRKEHASDVFILLGTNKVISEELAKKIAGAVGLRNILVHEYTDIDYQLAYKDLKEKIQDLKQFGKEIVNFLDK